VILQRASPRDQGRGVGPARKDVAQESKESSGWFTEGKPGEERPRGKKRQKTPLSKEDLKTEGRELDWYSKEERSE